jgi:hypothetical protein
MGAEERWQRARAAVASKVLVIALRPLPTAPSAPTSRRAHRPHDRTARAAAGRQHQRACRGVAARAAQDRGAAAGRGRGAQAAAGHRRRAGVVVRRRRLPAASGVSGPPQRHRPGSRSMAGAPAPDLAAGPRPHIPPPPSRLVGETWLFLETECVEEVMDNLAHLIKGRAPRDLFLEDPSWLLRAQRGQRWLGEAALRAAGAAAAAGSGRPTCIAAAEARRSHLTAPPALLARLPSAPRRAPRQHHGVHVLVQRLRRGSARAAAAGSGPAARGRSAVGLGPRTAFLSTPASSLSAPPAQLGSPAVSPAPG